MADARSLKILVVDDEPVARARMERLLASAGEQLIESAADGPWAVDAIARRAPDLVFLDVQMPGFDGFEVVATVGADHMPLTVFVTAYEEHAARAFEAEALDY